jgi:tetratricopeptide (TPR) repeat protein
LFEASEGSSAAADLVLKVGARSDAGKEYRDLALSASNGAILWSTSIEQNATDSAALPQQLAVKAQRVLSCGGEALSYRRERMRQEALKTYLSGCTNFDTAYGANVDNSDQARLFEQVIAQAPHFQPAWAKLLITEVDNLPSASDPPQLQRKIAAQVVQARKLGMDFAELYVGEAATLSPADFVGIFRTYDRGLKRHPDDAILHRSRGERFLYVGRLNDAVQDIARAVELDPLSPANQQTLASAYA